MKPILLPYLATTRFYVAGIVLCLLLLTASQLTAQKSITLSGVVRQAESGETVIGATVVIPGLSLGTYTNDYGYYTLNLPAGNDSVTVRFVYSGFVTAVRTILPQTSQKLDIQLAVASLDEVVIEANSYQEQLKSTQMSVERISMSEARKIPALLGEVDIIKTLQLKPGVSSGSEGSSGIYVRGGGPDQNLVLLDNTVVYNPSHLFGFFSTFNSDAVKDVKLYKAGFPASYGGRLSSVIDVKMNEGNRRKFAGSGGLGLIASRLTLEGPLARDKASFIVSGRRTYVDLFTRLINEAQADNDNFNPIPAYFFYDLNAKLNYEISDKDQLFLSGYAGRDQFSFDDNTFDFNFNWGNTNATLRWNHLFSDKLFLNTSASYSDYEYKISNEFDVFAFSLGSRITDGALRTDFTWTPDNRHKIHFGASGIYHRFIVGRLNAGSDSADFNLSAGDTYYGTELGAYIEDEFTLNDKVSLNAGFRFSAFQSDSTWYLNPEPRLSARISLSDQVSLKASYARMAQYLHLVTNSGASLPTDIWYPSTDQVKPQVSDQVALGFSWSPNSKLLISNELYYKWLYNQIDFRDGANLFVNNDLESEFIFGRGWTYGNEFYIEKTQGKLTGWIGYTLSWAYREFDGKWRTGEYIEEDAINQGEVFFPRNDKRHDVIIVAIYDLSPRISVSATWEYRSGNAITLATGRFFQLGPDFLTDPGAGLLLVPEYESRNSFRMPAYHRMDVGVTCKIPVKWGESDINLSAYNAYNRRNPYFIYIAPINNANGIPISNEARQVALFPIIPSISYNFKF
ncbi:MAG: TonB-dependent receptor [Bacteroidia bacterium]|nr:TonB-dependent receptor [Bacteroidia bacterium]